MLRRLTLLLLLVPAPLAAQFTPITAPGGDLYWYLLSIDFNAVAGPPSGDFETYLLDSGGSRVRRIWASGQTPTQYVGTFAPGEVFGIETFATGWGVGGDDPAVVSGDLSRGLVTLSSPVDGPGDMLEVVNYQLGTTLTPEPVSILLLGSGLVVIGLVARKRRKVGVI